MFLGQIFLQLAISFNRQELSSKKKTFKSIGHIQTSLNYCEKNIKYTKLASESDIKNCADERMISEIRLVYHGYPIPEEKKKFQHQQRDIEGVGQTRITAHAEQLEDATKYHIEEDSSNKFPHDTTRFYFNTHIQSSPHSCFFQSFTACCFTCSFIYFPSTLSQQIYHTRNKQRPQ